MSGVIHWRKCVTCDGVGTIIEETARGGHRWKRCPRCDGTGLMEMMGHDDDEAAGRKHA